MVKRGTINHDIATISVRANNNFDNSALSSIHNLIFITPTPDHHTYLSSYPLILSCLSIGQIWQICQGYLACKDMSSSPLPISHRIPSIIYHRANVFNYSSRRRGWWSDVDDGMADETKTRPPILELVMRILWWWYHVYRVCKHVTHYNTLWILIG